MKTIITTENLSHITRQQMTFTVQPRVTSMWGAGVMVYAKSDGWVGIRLDGETRVDEYPVEHVRLDGALVATAGDH
jgi:hypothetical protein